VWTTKPQFILFLLHFIEFCMAVIFFFSSYTKRHNSFTKRSSATIYQTHIVDKKNKTQHKISPYSVAIYTCKNRQKGDIIHHHVA